MTTWMDREDIILSEIIWTDSKNCMISLIHRIKKKKHLIERTDSWGMGSWGNCSGDLMYSMVTIVNNTILHI